MAAVGVFPDRHGFGIGGGKLGGSFVILGVLRLGGNEHGDPSSSALQ